MEIMINHLVLNRTENSDWINQDNVGNTLFKIALISSDNQEFKMDLLKFLLTHLDKRNDTFYFICRELIATLEPKDSPTFIEELKSALSSGLFAKAKYLINKTYRTSNSLEIFQSIGTRGDFTGYELRKLAKILNLDKDIRQRLKEISEKVSDFQQLMVLITNPENFEEFINS